MFIVAGGKQSHVNVVGTKTGPGAMLLPLKRNTKALPPPSHQSAIPGLTSYPCHTSPMKIFKKPMEIQINSREMLFNWPPGPRTKFTINLSRGPVTLKDPQRLLQS